MHLTPAKYAIVKFKGIRGLARALNVDQSYVHRWKKNGLIPAKYQAPLIQASWEHDILITEHSLIWGCNMDGRWIKKNMPWII